MFGRSIAHSIYRFADRMLVQRAMFTSSLLNGTFEDQFKRHLVMIESRHVIGDTNLVRNMVDYILTGPLSKNQLPN